MVKSIYFIFVIVASISLTLSIGCFDKDSKKLAHYENTKYIIDVYNTSGGATSGFSIAMKYRRKDTGFEKEFLSAYHCSMANVEFLSEDTISIGLGGGYAVEKTLIVDLASDTTYYHLKLTP